MKLFEAVGGPQYPTLLLMFLLIHPQQAEQQLTCLGLSGVDLPKNGKRKTEASNANTKRLIKDLAFSKTEIETGNGFAQTLNWDGHGGRPVVEE